MVTRLPQLVNICFGANKETHHSLTHPFPWKIAYQVEDSILVQRDLRGRPGSATKKSSLDGGYSIIIWSS